MYMPGRVRTCSTSSRTRICASPYIADVADGLPSSDASLGSAGADEDWLWFFSDIRRGSDQGGQNAARFTPVADARVAVKAGRGGSVRRHHSVRLTLRRSDVRGGENYRRILQGIIG